MKVNVERKYSGRVDRAVIAGVAAAILMAPCAYASSWSHTVLVPPMDLPVLARQSGEAMFLHETIDGKTLLYVEHAQGSDLAILDVSDPAHIKSEGAVALGASGAFDFVSAIGDQSELVRFRDGQGSAVLDLHKVNAPTLKSIQGQALPDQTRAPEGAGANADGLSTALDLEHVTQQIANDSTGTTFLLTQRGLYVLRRPVLEMIQQMHEQNYAN